MSSLSGWLRAFRWRKWLRALHRDAGYLAVGLTFVYAVSGIAINHIDDWDPNFEPIDEEFGLPGPVTDLIPTPGDPAGARTAAEKIISRLGRTDVVDDAYAVDPQHLDITLQNSTLYVDFSSRAVREEGQRPRPLLRVANWLHLNRGKKAWTYIADGYAVFLLFLATSGLFMLPGRKGIFGRGALLAIVGAAVPVLYVVLSEAP